MLYSVKKRFWCIPGFCIQFVENENEAAFSQRSPPGQRFKLLMRHWISRRKQLPAFHYPSASLSEGGCFTSHLSPAFSFPAPLFFCFPFSWLLVSAAQQRNRFWVTSATLCPRYHPWAVQLCHFVLRICPPLPRDRKVPWHSLTLEEDDWMFQFLSSICALLSDQSDVPPGPCQPWRSHIEEIHLSLTKLHCMSSEKIPYFASSSCSTFEVANYGKGVFVMSGF